MRKTALFIATILACVFVSTAVAWSQCVALTFDDGPNPATTPKLLAILKHEGVKVTFFVVGDNVRQWPDIVRAAYADGHEIGNHTWSHPNLVSLSDADVRSEIARTDAVVKAATGTAPRLIRAPYGSTNLRIERLFYDRPFIGWSVDTLDWMYRNTPRVIRSAVASYKGGIMLMHDIHASTVAAVPAIIAEYKARGARFVTVSEFRSGACAGVRSAKVKIH